MSTSYPDAPVSLAEHDKIKRVFVPSPFGQVHARIYQAETESDKPPLILFHPTPYSSRFYDSFAPEMAHDRVVISLDTPGYGDSDAPPEPQDIAGYASALFEALTALGYGKDNRLVDVFGYHTGCLIAAEIAASHPGTVRKLVLPGIPHYVGAAQQNAYAENAKPTPIAPDGAHLLPIWEFAALARPLGLDDLRVQELFSDAMQCQPNCWWAYHGVFSYEGRTRFPEISQPALLMTLGSSLRRETEAAAALMPAASLIYLNDITYGGFDLHFELIAAKTRAFLDE